jgi:nitroimidazol reductase NimA-like FMN-containing flavoprotein (pyridoxamine 5'-phosphate oxidase superfamily)
MKTHALAKEQIEGLLNKAQVGRIATQNPEGYPYVVPVHFVYHNGKIYIHGLPKGQKIENIINNPKVGFEIDEMLDLKYDGVEIGCDVNTEFNSVIAIGNAAILKDLADKREVLNKIVDKYTPHLSGKELPEGMVLGTAVIEIATMECTGKYYK